MLGGARVDQQDEQAEPGDAPRAHGLELGAAGPRGCRSPGEGARRRGRGLEGAARWRGQARGGGPRGGPGYRTRRPASPAGSCSPRASAPQSPSWDLRKGRGDGAPKHALSASFFLPCFLVSRAPSVFLRLSPPPPPLSPPLLAPFSFLPPPLPTAPPASPLRPPPPPPPFSCPFFFLLLLLLSKGASAWRPLPLRARARGPLPRLPGRCLQEFTIRRWGSGPGLHGDGFPRSREVRRRPRTINGSMQAPAPAPDQTAPGLRLVRSLSPWGASGGAEGAPPALARQEGRAAKVSARAARRGDKEGARCRGGSEGLHLETEMG